MVLPLDLDSVPGVGEFSSLAWWGDDLLVLPQFPTGPESDGLLVISRDSLARAIGEVERGAAVRPLRPELFRVAVDGITDSIPDYDGFEALAIDGDRCYALVEYGDDLRGGWGSRLLAGRIDGDARLVRFEHLGALRLEGPQMRRNFTHEALILEENEIWVFPELNGPGVVESSSLLRFGEDLRFHGRAVLPSLEFRVTDATEVDDTGRFWVLDIFWPDDVATIRPALGREPVERLVPLQVVGGVVVRDARRAILDLRADGQRPMHNWEGVARWGDAGFLLVTDSYPADLLAYVARPR